MTYLLAAALYCLCTGGLLLAMLAAIAWMLVKSR